MVHISDVNLVTCNLAVTNVYFQLSLIRIFDVVIFLFYRLLFDYPPTAYLGYHMETSFEGFNCTGISTVDMCVAKEVFTLTVVVYCSDE